MASDVVSLRESTGRKAEEMHTREGRRKDQEPVALAHRVDGEDANTAADLRNSG
jgi:hypothetical protein